jgi:hypothetical protein
MTLDKYKAFKEKFKEQAAIKLATNRDLIDAGIRDSSRYYRTYMKEAHMFSGDIQGYSMSQIREEIAEIEAKIEEFTNCPRFNICLEATAYSDYDSASVDEIYISAAWLYPTDNEEFESAWKISLRKELGELLKPKDKGYPLPVECKTIQMFEEEELTWKGMQKITYGTCDT